LATSNIFFADSVIATIEVKSELSGSVDGKLWEALDNCQSVKQLQLTDPSLFGEGKPAFWKFIRRLPSTYIFGYRGYKKDLSSLKKAIYTWIEVRKPSPVELPNVIVTDGCVVITNYGISEAFDSNSLRRTLGHDCVFVAREDPEALTWLLIHLLGYVGGIHTSAGGNTYARYAWGVNFAVNAFREREWQTWGRWVYDETTQIPPHFDLSDSFDSTFPQK
jgi:hypothetical protein